MVRHQFKNPMVQSLHRVTECAHFLRWRTDARNQYAVNILVQ
jgi:hypothetical protein